MPHVDILAEVAAGDPEVVLIERPASESPPTSTTLIRALGALGARSMTPSQTSRRATPTIAARVRAPRLARCAARPPDARAPGAPPRVAARTTARRAS